MRTAVVRTNRVASAPKRLKKCERGAACPYKHEHQHTAEYSHDTENVKPSARPPQLVKSSKGHKLGGSKTTTVLSRQKLLANAVDKRLKTETKPSPEVIDLSND